MSPRPKTDPSNHAQWVRVNIALRPEEAERLTAKAQAANLSVAELIRRALKLKETP